MNDKDVSDMIWVTNVIYPNYHNIEENEYTFQMLDRGWKLGPSVGSESPSQGLYRPKNWFDRLLEWLFSR